MMQPFSQSPHSKYMKKLFSLLLVLSLLVIFAAAAYYAYFFYQKQQQISQQQHVTITREGVLTKIQELNRLETMAFHIDTVVHSEKQGNWYKLWQDHEKGLFIVKGQVVAGVDLSKLDASDVTVSADGQKMIVDLPAAEVFSTQISNIQVYDHQRGWMNLEPLDNNLLQQAQNAAKVQIQQSACQAKILQLANDNASKQMTQLFSLTKMDITIRSQAVKHC